MTSPAAAGSALLSAGCTAGCMATNTEQTLLQRVNGVVRNRAPLPCKTHSNTRMPFGQKSLLCSQGVYSSLVGLLAARQFVLVVGFSRFQQSSSELGAAG